MNVKDRIFVPMDEAALMLTVFNEDEVLFVEVFEDNSSVTAAENWYASLGFGVCKEQIV
jgi:hypothetical protein